MDFAKPKAAVTPINGAPLTFISLIALQKSLSDFNFSTLNSKGSLVWSIIFTSLFSIQIVENFLFLTFISH